MTGRREAVIAAIRAKLVLAHRQLRFLVALHAKASADPDALWPTFFRMTTGTGVPDGDGICTWCLRRYEEQEEAEACESRHTSKRDLARARTRLRSRIGHLVLELRRAFAVSDSALAAAAEIPAAEIAAMESGRKLPCDAALTRVVTFFGARVEAAPIPESGLRAMNGGRFVPRE